MSSQDSMTMTDQDFTLLKTLVALAWADGSLAEGEVEWIDKVMDQLQVPPAQRDEMLKGAPPLPSDSELQEALPEGEDRETFLRFLLSVSLEDGETSLEELNLLKDLSHKLGVSGEALEEMRQSVLAP
ncbi:TerB family tellurite resistance protein [bacterium]|nr:TerB family tellurite resistance protein [bacterium]